MSVDQAFDNLMRKNALAIPMGDAANEQARPDGERRQGVGTDSVMRVSSLLDGDADDTDHLPFRDRNVEDELAALPEDVASAYRHGARIVSRDTEELLPTGEYGAEEETPVEKTRRISRSLPRSDTRRSSPASAPTTGVYADSDSRPEARLDGARRVRRFSYLPLSGMEAFETDVRDLAAGFAAFDSARPSLAVSSAVRGEGRTELSIRLALALAKRVGHKVLLADFDVRNPQVAARLGASSKRFTLADVLRGACPLADALTVSEEDNLYLLPSRPLDRDGDDLLDSRQAESLFAELHRTFDFTIIDCGPASQADAMILCRLAGFTVLAGYCGVSSAGRLNQAGERLKAAGARVAGVLLTGA